MKHKRRRLLEWGKTLLIVLLSCSALYLGAQALLPGGAARLLSRFSAPADSTASNGAQSAFADGTLRPAALAVTGERGRYGSLYSQEDQENYTQVSALLAEALSAAGQSRPISQRTWEAALAAPGVYWEYLGDLPLNDLSRWFSGQENAALAGRSACRLLVSDSQLLFYSAAQSTLYAAPLSADLSDMLFQLAGSFPPNGAQFAFESDAAQNLRGDLLLLPAAPTLPSLAGENPLTVDDTAQPGAELTQLLGALGFHPQTNPLYAITGGWAITDGSDTLRVTGQGIAHFRQSRDTEPRFPAGDHPLDVTRTLAEQTVGALCGDARLYLRSIETVGGVTTVTYGYLYQGAAIMLDGENWCAKFILENGAVTQFTLKSRRYTVSDSAPAALMPPEQAAALVDAQRPNMVLLYEDGRDADPMAPFWAATSR